jgi:hypothetical protein
MSSIQRKIWEERAGLLKEDTDYLSEEFTSLIEESYEYDSADVDFVFEIMEDIENILEALPKAAYVSAMRTTSDPEYQGKLDRDNVVARAKKHHGDKFAKDLEKGADKMHFPRANHSYRFSDPLAGQSRSSNPSHVTKAGKLTKASVKGLKSTIKSRMSA